MIEYVRAAEQAAVTKFRSEADGIEVWHNHVPRAGTILPQHSHPFPHLTVMPCGAVRLELDGELIGEFAAPWSRVIPAGTKHLFTTLVDDTVIECIHNVSRTGKIEILERHDLVGEV